VGLWLVRGGSHGEYEKRFLDDNRVYLTWSEGLQEHDLSGVHDHDAVRAIVEASYPGEPAKRIIATVAARQGAGASPAGLSGVRAGYRPTGPRGAGQRT
jgi:predicted Mrr-cat superfamily restriction endonuclease